MDSFPASPGSTVLLSNGNTPFPFVKFAENNSLASKIDAERSRIQTLHSYIQELNGELSNAQNKLLSQGDNQEKLATYYKKRYEGQIEINTQLERQIKKLDREIEKKKTKLKNTTLYGFDLRYDNLSEPELHRLLGEMETAKTNMRSELITLQWRLDNEGKECGRLEEIINGHRFELGIPKQVKLQRYFCEENDGVEALPQLGPHCLKWAPSIENRTRTAADITFKSSTLVSLPLLASPIGTQSLLTANAETQRERVLEENEK